MSIGAGISGVRTRKRDGKTQRDRGIEKGGYREDIVKHDENRQEDRKGNRIWKKTRLQR